MKSNGTGYEALTAKIRSLKEDRERQEMLVIEDLSKFYAIIQNPAPPIKHLVKDLASDKDFRLNLLKIMLNIGTGYLSSHPGKLASFISKIKGKPEKKDQEERQGSVGELLTTLLSKIKI